MTKGFHCARDMLESQVDAEHMPENAKEVGEIYLELSTNDVS